MKKGLKIRRQIKICHMVVFVILLQASCNLIAKETPVGDWLVGSTIVSNGVVTYTEAKDTKRNTHLMFGRAYNPKN